MRTRSFPLVLVVALLSVALLMPGCASKYGEKITKVNYYPQCYKPIEDLRADENAVAKSTAGGAIGGALIGAAIGAIATGKVEGAVAGAVAGGAAGAVGGNIYGKQKQKQRDAELLAQYGQQLDADVATMTRTVAAAKVATKCYDDEFKRIVAEYKAGRIKKQEMAERYAEIRTGLQEISYVLNQQYDNMAKKDQEYQAALADVYTKAQPKKAKSPKTTKAKAGNFKAVHQEVGSTSKSIANQRSENDRIMASLDPDLLDISMQL